MKDLYKAFQDIANKPQQGNQRKHRSSPYYMAPAGKHFAVYEPFGADVIIATVIHSKRDIETLIRKLGSDLTNEIDHIRSQLNQE